MKKDKNIKEILQLAPSPKEKDEFMRALDKKMQVVDVVRSEYKSSTRFYTYFSIICFVLGLLTGLPLLYVVLFHPIDWSALANPMSEIHLPQQMLPLCFQYGNILLCALACIFMVLGTLPLLKTRFEVVLYNE